MTISRIANGQFNVNKIPIDGGSQLGHTGEYATADSLGGVGSADASSGSQVEVEIDLSRRLKRWVCPTSSSTESPAAR